MNKFKVGDVIRDAEGDREWSNGPYLVVSVDNTRKNDPMVDVVALGWTDTSEHALVNLSSDPKFWRLDPFLTAARKANECKTKSKTKRSVRSQAKKSKA